MFPLGKIAWKLFAAFGLVIAAPITIPLTMLIAHYQNRKWTWADFVGTGLDTWEDLTK